MTDGGNGLWLQYALTKRRGQALRRWLKRCSRSFPAVIRGSAICSGARQRPSLGCGDSFRRECTSRGCGVRFRSTVHRRGSASRARCGMPMRRLTLMYLATYLLSGGGSLIVAPDLALRLLLSNGAYGDVMPRLFGLFMFVLGGVILQFVRARDYRYYLYTIVARCFIVVAMTVLYFKARDPLLLVLDAIVLIGLLPSIYVAAQTPHQ